MAYIDLSAKFGFNSTLQASDFNQLFENIISIAAQDSGTPNIKFVKQSTYTGNGSQTIDITGVGFEPNIGFLFGGVPADGNTANVFVKTGAMSNSNLINFYTSSEGINLFVEDGFKILRNTLTNSAGATYYYIMGKGA